MTIVTKFSSAFNKIGRDIFNINLLKNKFNTFISKKKAKGNEFLAKLKNLEQTNYNLGLFYYNNGAINDTIFRFKVIKLIWPNVVEANYFIGRSYLELLKIDKAKKYIDLYLSSGDLKFKEEATFCSHIIDNKLSSIKTIPLSLIKRYSNIMSRLHNNIQIEDNHSDQEQLVNSINSLLTEMGKPFSNTFLDIGCGTGTIGELIRKSKTAKMIEGIDVSEKIVEVASQKLFEAKPIYDTVVTMDFESFAKQCNKSYDVIIASRFLDYYTNLTELLNFCKQHLNKNGIIGFTIKTATIPTLYEIIPSLEEFTFNLKLIEETLKQCGLISKNIIEVSFPDGYKGYCFILINN